MRHSPVLSRSSFWLKAGLVAALVAVADVLFLWHAPGTTVGVFALAWLAALVLARPGLLRESRGRMAMVAAVGMALVLADRPGLLAWTLFGLAAAVAVMSANPPGAGRSGWWFSAWSVWSGRSST